MKNLVWMVGGICAAAAGYLVWGAIHTRNIAAQTPVEELAHRLEDAWVDHHTVV